MDKSTGEPLLVNEQQITAELEFTPDSAGGTVELTYTFDASALAGKSVVVFEDLYQGDSLVASHANLEDEDQTISFGQPKIGTTATVDGEKAAQPAEQITITDTVEYSGPHRWPGVHPPGRVGVPSTGEPVMSDEERLPPKPPLWPPAARAPSTSRSPLMPPAWKERPWSFSRRCSRRNHHCGTPGFGGRGPNHHLY